MVSVIRNGNHGMRYMLCIWVLGPLGEALGRRSLSYRNSWTQELENFPCSSIHCLHAHLHINKHVIPFFHHVHIHICTHIHRCTCIYVHICVYMYKHIYTGTHTH